MLQFGEGAVGVAAILHKNLVADFHKAGAVGGRVGEAIFLNVLLVLAKIVEDFRVGTARVAERRGFNATATAPPVFVVVVEEDAFAGFDSPLGAVLGGANFGNFGVNAGFLKDCLPNLSGLGVFRDAVFLVADEAGDIDFVRIQADFFGEEGEEVFNLLLLEVIAERPVAKHLKHRGVAGVANVVNILETQGGLRVGEAGAFRVGLTEQIRQQRLHPGAGEEGGGVVLQHQRGGRDDFVSVFNLKIKKLLANLVGVHGVYYSIKGG